MDECPTNILNHFFLISSLNLKVLALHARHLLGFKLLAFSKNMCWRCAWRILATHQLRWKERKEEGHPKGFPHRINTRLQTHCFPYMQDSLHKASQASMPILDATQLHQSPSPLWLSSLHSYQQDPWIGSWVTVQYANYLQTHAPKTTCLPDISMPWCSTSLTPNPTINITTMHAM